MPKTLRQKKRGKFSYRRHAKILRKQSVRRKRSVRRKQSLRRKKMRGGKITFEILNNIKTEIENFKKLFREIEFSWEQIAPAQDKYLYKYTTLFYYLPALPNYSEIDKKSYYKPGLNEEERRRAERYDFVRPNTKYDFLKHLQKFLESKEAIKLRDFVKQYLTPDNLKEFEFSSKNLPNEDLPNEDLQESLAKCLNQFQNVDFKFARSYGEYYALIDEPQQYYITIPILTYICTKYVTDSFYEVTDKTGYRQIDFFENFQKFITEYNGNPENEKIINKTQFLQSTKPKTDFFPLPDLLSEFDFTENAAERLWKLFYTDYKHPTIDDIDQREKNKKEYEDRKRKEEEQEERERERAYDKEYSKYLNLYGNFANNF